MGGFSLWHWLVVGLVILLLFGRGRFSEMMGDVAKGLKNFKRGMAEDEELGQRETPRQIARDGRDAPAVTHDAASTPRERPLDAPARTELERDTDRRA